MTETNTLTDEEVRRRRRKRILRFIGFSAAAVATGAIAVCIWWMWGNVVREQALPQQQQVTDTPHSTLTPLPTFTPTATHTQLPTDTPTPSPYVSTEDGAVNVRSGPGLEYVVVGILDIDQTAPITGYNGKWWRIEFDGAEAWVATWVVTSHYTYGVPLIPVDGSSGDEPTALPKLTD